MINTHGNLELDLNLFFVRLSSTIVLVISACIALSACGSSDDSAGPVDDGVNTGLPTSPVNPRSIILSENSVRLLWDDAQDDHCVVSYDVSRDGEAIASGIRVNKFTDSELLPNTSYSYAITAIDDENNRGAQASISVTTPQQTPALTLENYVPIADYVFSTISGRILGDLPDVYKFPIDRAPIATELDEFRTFACDNGGFAYEHDYGHRKKLLFDKCEWNSKVYSGLVEHSEITVNTSAAVSVSRLIFSELKVTDSAERLLTVDGTIKKEYGCDNGSNLSITSDIKLLKIENPDGDSSIDNLLVSGEHAESCDAWDFISITDGLTLQSPSTGNKTLVVSNPIRFDRLSPDDSHYSAGQLLIQGNDKTEILIDADNGDLMSVDVTYTINGTATHFQELWSSWGSI